MSTPLSLTQRDALAAHLLSRFKCTVAEKSDWIFMRWIAGIFRVASLLGANVPDDFLTRYWTTLGPVVFAPTGLSTQLGAHLHVVAHEVTHGVQFWRNVATLVAKYASGRGRAELEAEAERGAIEVSWVVDGVIPVTLDDLDVCRHGYAIEDAPGEHDDFADLARDLLEQAVTSVRAGVLSTDVGIETHRWMLANARSAIQGTVL